MEALTTAEIGTLRFAPLWVFSAMVGREHGFHLLEEKALWAAVEETADRTDGLAHDLLFAIALDDRRVLARYAEDNRPIASGLHDVNRILSRLAPEIADSVKAAVLQVGERFGRARGPFGQMITQDDKDILQLVAEILEAQTAGSLFVS
jgi:hypothetical protein